ncbi:unnamed protein product [Ambrosiozyma monospora]|uniref:Unnamed protein product n=1 Tax=Ambrosiozyma monospora TaxID=43982 RepID=A0ACB5SR12_AMBMO|nr:unnamed protein product [Ambrosiozyma monospora]
MQLQLFLSKVNENKVNDAIRRTQNWIKSPSHWLPSFDLKLCALCAIWYLTSVISSNSTKAILRNFQFPVTLTELQFLMNAIYCLLAVVFVKKYDHYFNKTYRQNRNLDSLYIDETGTLLGSFPKGTFPSELNQSDYSIRANFLKPTLFVLKTTLPMGLFQFVGHIASHNATSIIPVSLVHTIKALSPLTTVLIYRVFFGQHFSVKTYATLLPLITGVMLSCVKNNNLLITENLFYKGCIFAFISMLIFVSQNIFAKKILTFESSPKEDYFTKALNMRVARGESASTTPILPISLSPKNMSPPVTPLLGNSSQSLNKLVHNAEKKLDKMSVLFYCSLVGFCLTLPVYIISEFTNPVLSVSLIDSDMSTMMLINGLSHFVQSIVAFQILGMISPINYSIANILKRIIIISCSIVVEGTKLNSVQWVGLSLTFIGLYCYDKWGVQRKR